MEQNENTLSVLKIAPGQYPQQVEIDNDLKALQQEVGVNIGASYPFSDPVAIVYNDEGICCAQIFTIRHTSVCTRTRVHRQKVSIKTQQTVSAKLRLKKSFSPWQMKPISPRQYDELILQRKAIRRRSVH